MQTSPRHPRWSRFILLALLLSCGRSQTRDQADFWQEALPEPIAVLDPWLSTPVSNTTLAEEWSGHVVELSRFVDGPADATGADQTVHLRDASTTERELHLRLPHGTAVPLFRNEAVKIRVFSRLGDDGAVQRSLIVSARRPLGKGADFRPVLVISRFDGLIPQEALPPVLTGVVRTEQVVYREARKDEGECTVATTHFLVNVGLDALTSRKRPTFAPGAHIRRQDQESSYDLVIHDARRDSYAPCAVPDASALAWSAVWVEEEVTKGAHKTAPMLEPLALPQPATPAAQNPAPGHAPAHKVRKAPLRDAVPHEHQAPRP